MLEQLRQLVGILCFKDPRGTSLVGNIKTMFLRVWKMSRDLLWWLVLRGSAQWWFGCMGPHIQWYRKEPIFSNLVKFTDTLPSNGNPSILRHHKRSLCCNTVWRKHWLWQSKRAHKCSMKTERVQFQFTLIDITFCNKENGEIQFRWLISLRRLLLASKVLKIVFGTTWYYADSTVVYQFMPTSPGVGYPLYQMSPKGQRPNKLSLA